MTKILIIFLLLISVQISTQPEFEVIIEPQIKVDFYQSYNKLRKWEGNYGWYKEDPGGETYAGIARKYNKDWIGWYILDDYKKDSSVYHNKRIERLEPFVLDYYLSRWVKYEYYNLKDQQIANYIFDYHNQGPVAAIHISQVLNEQDSTFKVINYWTVDMIQKLNSVDSSFIEKVRRKRIWYYTVTVINHPKQKKFWNGWYNRAMDI